MTVRHTLLAVGAVLVLGMTLYLVREVSRSPSDAQASAPVQPSPPPRSPAETVAPPPATEPPGRAVLPSTPSAARDRFVAAGEPPPRTAPVAPVEPATSVELPSRFANPRLDAVMGEANKAYDAGEFDEAKQIALKVLAKSPGNVRMLRIVVSAECIAGDPSEAQKYYAQLPAPDRAQMRTRCDRYGVTFKDP